MDILTFAAAASAHGWSLTLPSENGPRYATLSRGPVSVGLSQTPLYYHKGRVCWGDPCFGAQPGVIVIATLVVDAGSRRMGLATAAMRSLLSIDGYRIVLEATPTEDGGMSRQRLIRWYRSLGFSPAFPGKGEEILCHGQSAAS